MKAVRVFINSIPCGILEEIVFRKRYRFTYDSDYKGGPVSLLMPLTQKEYDFDLFPPFFEGLLPEGIMLEGLLKKLKIDRHDLMSQLIAVGHDMVGYVTVEVI